MRAAGWERDQPAGAVAISASATMAFTIGLQQAKSAHVCINSLRTSSRLDLDRPAPLGPGHRAQRHSGEVAILPGLGRPGAERSAKAMGDLDAPHAAHQHQHAHVGKRPSPLPSWEQIGRGWPPTPRPFVRSRKSLRKLILRRVLDSLRNLRSVGIVRPAGRRRPDHERYRSEVRESTHARLRNPRVL